MLTGPWPAEPCAPSLPHAATGAELGARARGVGSFVGRWRAGLVPCLASAPADPGLPWGASFRPVAVGPGIGCALGGRGSTGKGGSGDMGCLCFQGPLGLLAGEDTGRPERWPGRVRALSTQPVPGSQGLGPVEAGREGRVGSGSSLSGSTRGGWQCVRRSVCRALRVLVGAAPSPPPRGCLGGIGATAGTGQLRGQQ